jgi:hypothetical protein
MTCTCRRSRDHSGKERDRGVESTKNWQKCAVFVELWFSIGQQIYVSCRNCLSDENFEKLLFLKNKDL